MSAMSTREIPNTLPTDVSALDTLYSDAGKLNLTLV
jgi:hypothetical protein